MKVLKGRGDSSMGRLGASSSFIFSFVLFFICVANATPSFVSQTEQSFDGIRTSHISHDKLCEVSDDLILTQEKVKRGPFSDLKQMERVHMLDTLLEKVLHSLNKGGVCFWAERDTLLAAYRHGNTLPYAGKHHLAILTSSFDKAVQVLSSSIHVEVGDLTLEEDKEQGTIRVQYVKLGLRASVKIRSYTPATNGRRLDNPTSVFHPLVASVFPLKKAFFNGQLILVPANVDRYLMGQYGPSYDQTDRYFDWETMSYIKGQGKEEYPLVSIIIPTYGRPAFLKKTIEFIKRQDYPNIEVVIVDDSPQPISGLIAEEDAERFHYYHLSARKSIGMKRNIAVEKSKGAVIVHWDDDDYFREHRVTQQVAPILRGAVQMTVLEHHLYFHLPSKAFYHVKRASTWGPHFATFVFSRTLWEDGIRYPDNSMAEDYAFAEAALRAGYKIDVLNNEDGKHVYVRHKNTWEFELEDYAAQVQKVDRPEFFSEKDESFFLTVETKSLPKPPRHFAPETIQWNRPELQPGWKTGGLEGVSYPPYYPPYYPKYPSYNDDDDVFDATWIFVGVAGGLPVVLAVVLGAYYFYKRSQRHDYTLIGGQGLNSVA